MPVRIKTDTLLSLSIHPGLCTRCRHLNHKTADFQEGRMVCRLDFKRRHHDELCALQCSLRKTQEGPTGDYYYFEKYTGDNETYMTLHDSRVMAENADDSVRKWMGVDRPFIAIGES